MKTSYIKGRLLFTAMVMTLITAFSSCQEDYKLELPLALTQEELTLGASGGSTHVIVYSTGNWTASFKDPDDESWASIEMGSGKDNGEFIFNFAKNPGLGRQAIIVITTGSETKELAMNQSGYVTAPNVTLLNQNFAMPSWESTSAVPFYTNLDLALDRIYAIIDYGDFDTADGADNSKVETIRATKEEPGWLTGIVVEEDTIRFKVDENAEGLPRVARLTIRATNETTNRNYNTQAFVTQTATSGYFRFNAPEQPAEVESFAKTVSFLWDTNMDTYFNKLKFDVTYDEPGEPWISNLVPTKTGLQADIAESTFAGERHATITVTYNGPEGTVSATRKVTQARPALEVAYADLRARLSSAGTYTPDADYIMARVITDPANPNSETNPKPSWKTVDLTESTRTAYIQSLDGQYGFRIKLAAGESPDILQRYAVIKIALAGLTIEREDNPARYTIRDFKAENILETTPGDENALNAKTKHINQLTDDDIYTFVVLKDVEMAVPCGSWVNYHNGYATKTDLTTAGENNAGRGDCAARFFRDINGDNIPMLFNSQCPWRYDDAVAPVGSGTVGAVVVYAPLDRQHLNGEMGRYQIRALSRKDINLDKTSSFSNTIALWKWNSTADILRPDENVKTKVKANEGEGFMNTDAVLGKDCNLLTGSFYNVNFATKNLSKSFYYCAEWWDFTADKGKSITWEFSTKGISGKNLAMCFTGGVGYQAAPGHVPTLWNVEYSTDGVNFTSLKKNWYFYPTVTWAYEGNDSPAGNAEHIFDLPDNLFGRDKVVIRITAASKKTMNTKGLTKTNVANASADKGKRYLRFECISIKYNK